MESFKKEVFIALIVGIIFGLISVLAFTGSFKKIFDLFSPQRTTTSLNAISKVIPSPIIVNESNYAISPNNDDVFYSPIATISGKIKPNSNIIISSESDDKIIASNLNGDFNIETSLRSGHNLIVITLFPFTENEVIKELTLYYFPKE